MWKQRECCLVGYRNLSALGVRSFQHSFVSSQELLPHLTQSLGTTGLRHSPWLTKPFWGGLNHDELKGHTAPLCLLNTPAPGRHRTGRFLPFTWKGITRLTASPTLRMYVCFRCLGMRIFGGSGEGWRSIGVQPVSENALAQVEWLGLTPLSHNSDVSLTVYLENLVQTVYFKYRYLFIYL